LGWLILDLRVISILMGLVIRGVARVVVLNSQGYDHQLIIKYLIVQEVGSLLVLAGVAYGLPLLSFVGVVIKLGLPPFHAWIVDVLLSATSYSFV